MNNVDLRNRFRRAATRVAELHLTATLEEFPEETRATARTELPDAVASLEALLALLAEEATS